MSKKRLRIFAGPNGSGKSTFINEFESSDLRYKLGVYVNADEIEKKLKEAIRFSNRAYLFDTSRTDFETLLFAEVTNGVEVEKFTPKKLPSWFIDYVVEKNTGVR